MRIIQISDTHGKHHLLTSLPEGDVVVHCGDFTEDGTEEEVLDFLNWFMELPYRHKIFVTGNHDLCLREAEKLEIRRRLNSLAKALNITIFLLYPKSEMTELAESEIDVLEEDIISQLAAES